KKASGAIMLPFDNVYLVLIRAELKYPTADGLCGDLAKPVEGSLTIIEDEHVRLVVHHVSELAIEAPLSALNCRDVHQRPICMLSKTLPGIVIVKVSKDSRVIRSARLRRPGRISRAQINAAQRIGPKKTGAVNVRLIKLAGPSQVSGNI